MLGVYGVIFGEIISPSNIHHFKIFTEFHSSVFALSNSQGIIEERVIAIPFLGTF